MAQALSSVLRLTDLDDFINPSQVIALLPLFPLTHSCIHFRRASSLNQSQVIQMKRYKFHLPIVWPVQGASLQRKQYSLINSLTKNLLIF